MTSYPADALTAAALPADQTGLSNWPITRREIRDWVLSPSLLRSRLDPKAEELIATLWSLFAGGCHAPFPFVAGELDKFNWKPRSTKRWFQLIFDQKWITLLPANEELGAGFEHLRLFQFTDRILPPAETENGQLLLFEKEPFAPPAFLGRLHDLTKIIAPTLLLMDSRLPSGVIIPAWYYDLDGDWETKITRIHFDKFKVVFNRDPGRFRELKRTMKHFGYWEELGAGPGYVDIKRCKAFHLPQQQRILAAMADFDPSLVKLLLPMVESIPQRAAVLLPGAAVPAMPAADSATESAAPAPVSDRPAADSATESAAPAPVSDRPAADSATESAAPDPVSDRPAADSATKSAAPDPVSDRPAADSATKSAATAPPEREQISRTEAQQAAVQAKLAQLPADEASSAHKLRFKIFENRKIKDLEGTGQENIEHPPDKAYRIADTEKAIIKKLGNGGGHLYPWYRFLVAAMVNGYSAQWYLRDGKQGDDRPLPLVAFSEQDLAAIIEFALDVPMKDRSWAFIGVVNRRVLEIAGYSRDESEQLKKRLQTPAWSELRAYAREINYPWPSDRDMREPVRTA